MIARYFIFYIIAIVLSGLYFDRHFNRRRLHLKAWVRLVYWLPSLAMIAYTLFLASLPNFVPDDLRLLNLYLLLVGVYVIPKTLWALCAATGLAVCRLTHRHHNYGNLIGPVLAALAAATCLYGSFVGVKQLEMRHVELGFTDLPADFDGYRIVQFGDAHVGTFCASQLSLLSRDIDSINAQHPDLIVFTGDLQNEQPSELTPAASILSRLHARDGVFSVMGNHDYAGYIDASETVKTANERKIRNCQKQYGWTLLANEWRWLRHGSDSIVIAGEENYGKPMMANLPKTLRGVSPQSFVILLQHNPAAWREHILPNSHVQLTLSGHTHGGQVSLFGWRPTHVLLHEDYGYFSEHGRQLYTTSGLSGVVPFRIGMPAEIVVITLRKIQQQ